jgi:2-polyprenyl-6-methoxyphenol hydroxylase-like FAD-dependent oxidoreductase
MQPTDDQFDVVVAGQIGAPLALLLARRGRQVALFETTPQARGKTRILGRQRSRSEMFGGVWIPAIGSPANQMVHGFGIQDWVHPSASDDYVVAIR